jgi:hypothetical protein
MIIAPRASAIGKNAAGLLMISSHVERRLEPFRLRIVGAIKEEIERSHKVKTFAPSV